MPAPSVEPQAAVLALPARARVLPVLLAHRPLNRAFHVPGQAQLEQIRLAPPLGFAHHRLVAETDIAADQPRPQLARQAIQQLPQPRRGVLGSMLVAGRNLDRQHQAQIGHHVAVITVRRPSPLVRIVAHHGALLAAVERLHGGVDIEYPRFAQQRSRRVIEMLLQPRKPGALLDLVDAAFTASSLTT